MDKTVRVYLSRIVNTNEIKIFNKRPTIIAGTSAVEVLKCDLSIRYYNKNPSILDIRRTMDKLELTVSEYPSRLRLSVRGNMVFKKIEFVPSFYQEYMITEKIKVALRKLGYEEGFINVILDNPSFNYENMVEYKYSEVESFVRKSLIEKGLKIID